MLGKNEASGKRQLVLNVRRPVASKGKNAFTLLLVFVLRLPTAILHYGTNFSYFSKTKSNREMRNKRHSKSADFHMLVVFSETLSRLSCGNNASYFSALLTNTSCNFYDFSTHFLRSFLMSPQPALILLVTTAAAVCMGTRQRPVSTLSSCLSLSSCSPHTYTFSLYMHVYKYVPVAPPRPAGISVVHMGTNTLISMLAVSAVKKAIAE